MTDKKFTDEEIIKALECCTKAKTMGDCIELNCPFRNDWDLCLSSEIQKMALDLINRQKAEIEELKNYVNRCKSGEEYWVKCLLEKPNEAIKEFADMVKKNIKEVWNYDNGTCSCVLVLTKDIDNLLKEMISEE